MALLVAGLSGCTSDPTDEINPTVAVFLTSDVTEQQKQAIEARLRAVPDAAEVTFVSSEQAYQEVKERLKGDPELLDSIDAEHMPQSFRLTLRDRDAFDRAAAGPLRTELGALPGVHEVIFPSTNPTPPPSPSPTPSPTPNRCDTVELSKASEKTDWLDVWVYLTYEITESEKQAVEAKLRTIPGIAQLRLKTSEEAARGFKDLTKDIPAMSESNRPERFTESYEVKLADQAAVAWVADSEIDVELCQLSGVTRVVVPRKN